ncbi:MAG: GAF domain-containing protein [Chloroflexota bacterium]
MPNTRVLLIDEGKMSLLEIQPELLRHGFYVELIRSKEELDAHLETYPTYDVVLVERDLPLFAGGERKKIGMDIARDIGCRLNLAQVILFEEVDVAERGEVQRVYKLIKKPENFAEILDEIRLAEHVVLKRRLKSLENQLAQIGYITTALLTQRSEKQIFETIIQGVKSLCFDRVRIYLLADDGKHLKGVASEGLDSKDNFYGKLWESHYISHDFDPNSAPEPIIYQNGNRENIVDYESAMGREPLKQWIVVPLVSSGRVIGKLTADNLVSNRQIHNSEKKPLLGIASHAAIAIEKMWAKDQEKHIHLVQSVTNKIAKLTNPEDVYPAISQAVVGMFDHVDHSGLVLFDNDYQFGKVAAEFPEKVNASMVGVKIPIKGIPFEEKLLQGAPFVHSPDIAEDESMEEVGEILLDLGIKSVLIIPLRHNDRLIGSFSLDAVKQKHHFGQEDIEIAQIFAGHVSAAIGNSQKRNQLESIHQISLALNQVTDSEKIYELLVQHAIKAVGATGGGIHLIDQNRLVIRNSADIGHGNKEPYEIPFGTGMVGELMRRDLKYLSTSNYGKERYAIKFHHLKKRFGSVLKMLLEHKNRPIGFLYVDDRIGRVFNEIDEEKLKPIVSLAGSAIFQHRLLESQKTQSRQLEVLHYLGDIVELAEDVRTVINFSLIGLTATYALNFDRAAYFLVDSQNPKILRGKVGFGHLSYQDWVDHDKDYELRGIIDRKTHEIAYHNNQLSPTPLNDPIRAITIDLSSIEAAILNDLLDVDTTWFHEDYNKTYVRQMPQSIQDIFLTDGPLVIVPMVVSKQVIGFLIVDNPFSKRIIRSVQLKATKTFVTSTAVAINRIRLQQKEREQAKQLQTIIDISQQSASAHHLKKPLEDVISHLKEFSGADKVAFIRLNLEHLDPNREHLWQPSRIHAIDDIDNPVSWMRSSGNSVDVLKNGRPKFFGDLSQEDSDSFNYAKGTIGMAAAACIPAITNENKLGVVWLYFKEVQPFDAKTVGIWQVFVNQAAALYQVHSDFDKLESERKLTEGVQVMVAAKNMEGVYDRIVNQTRVVLEKEKRKVNVVMYGFSEEKRIVTRAIFDESYQYSQKLDPKLFGKNDLREKLICELLQGSEITNFSVGSKLGRQTGFKSIDWELLLPEENLKAVSIVPIVWEGHPLALMVIGYWFAQPFSNSQHASLDRLAKGAALALQNAKESRDKDVEMERFNALQTINQIVADAVTLKPEDLFLQVTTLLYEFMINHDKKALFCDLRLRDGDYLDVKSVYPIDFDHVLSRVHLGQPYRSIGLTGIAFKEQQVIAVQDVHDDDHFRPTTHQTRSELVVPIMVRGNALGVLNIEFSVTNGFDDRDIRLIEAFAGRISSILVKSHIFDQQKMLQEASTIVATAITDDIDTQTDQLLEQVVRVFKPLNGSKIRLSTIQFKDEESNQLYIDNAYPKEKYSKWIGRENAHRLRAGNKLQIGISGRVQESGNGEYVNDVNSDANYVEIHPHTKSQMVVPLKVENKVIGSLSVESSQRNAFMPEDLESLETFAKLVTILRKIGGQYSQLMDARRRVESATALGMMSMISGVWQHANKGRAVTIRDRVQLLAFDLQDKKMSQVQEHINIIEEAANEIIARRIQENLGDPTATKPEIVSKCIRKFIVEKVEARDFRVKVKTDLLPDYQYPVRMQSDYFQEMLSILVNNARKALSSTDKPEIKIKTSVNIEKQEYTVDVLDNGPGFPEHVIQNLLHKPVAKKAGEEGSGIGLLMARLIAETFDGKILAKNCLAGGAKITIQFPIDKEERG